MVPRCVGRLVVLDHHPNEAEISVAVADRAPDGTRRRPLAAPLHRHREPLYSFRTGLFAAAQQPPLELPALGERRRPLAPRLRQRQTAAGFASPGVVLPRARRGPMAYFLWQEHTAYRCVRTLPVRSSPHPVRAHTQMVFGVCIEMFRSSCANNKGPLRKT